MSSMMELGLETHYHGCDKHPIQKTESVIKQTGMDNSWSFISYHINTEQQQWATLFFFM